VQVVNNYRWNQTDKGYMKDLLTFKARVRRSSVIPRSCSRMGTDGRPIGLFSKGFLYLGSPPTYRVYRCRGRPAFRALSTNHGPRALQRGWSCHSR
jgi:hypothetical protein